VLNPGGPGGSGVDHVVQLGSSLYTAEVRARFDLVGFDPRGIGRSSALRCFGTTNQALSTLTPDPFPMTRDELSQRIAADSQLASACDRGGGRIVDHMATADVARDMDSLRAALGDAQLTYAGVSYGSYLGVTYANMFPDKVRAVVVDGVIEPIAWSTGRNGEAATLPFSTRLHLVAGLRGDARGHRARRRRPADRGARRALPRPFAVPAEAGLPALPQLRRGLPGGRLRGQQQPGVI
jgi:pimeloyl-ACP methyl ester carboxylesterase